MVLNAFQRMVVATMAGVIGPMAESLARYICGTMGIALERLAQEHMEEFSDRFQTAAEGTTEGYKIVSTGNILRRFKDSKVGRDSLLSQVSKATDALGDHSS